MLPQAALDRLDATDLEMIEEMMTHQHVGDTIRRAGFPCKHVYRFFTAAESDIRLNAEPVSFALYTDLNGSPHTACFAGTEAVLVSEGW